MRSPLLSLSQLALLAASASAQYFSQGWNPGQTATREAKEAPTQGFVPGQNPPPAPGSPTAGGLSSLFDISNILTSKPIAGLFEKAGINITERIAAGKAIKLWDDRIPLITDDNYFDLIVNETLTEEEEKERVWAIIITPTAARQDQISKFFDSKFDEAYNETVIAGDLQNVRWGRIDYLNVTGITTKWCVWTAPHMVILQDRGRILRFFRPQQMRMADGAFREFLISETWRRRMPWQSSFAPGGSREIVLHYFAIVLTKSYDVLVLVPRWLLYVLSGTVASFVLNLLHRGDKKPTAGPKPKPESEAPAPQPAVEAAPPTQPSTTKRGGAKQRKGKK